LQKPVKASIDAGSNASGRPMRPFNRIPRIELDPAIAAKQARDRRAETLETTGDANKHPDRNRDCAETERPAEGSRYDAGYGDRRRSVRNDDTLGFVHRRRDPGGKEMWAVGSDPS